MFILDRCQCYTLCSRGPPPTLSLFGQRYVPSVTANSALIDCSSPSLFYPLSHSSSLLPQDPLVFHCGVRRFSAAPIFSQHTAGNKHKVWCVWLVPLLTGFLYEFLFSCQYERFFHSDGVCVATVYAPISYPPQSVLVFKPEQGTLTPHLCTRFTDLLLESKCV